MNLLLLKKIMYKYNPSLRVVSVYKLTGGNINQMYEIRTASTAYILRLTTLITVKKELRIYSLMRKSGLPVPTILFRGERFYLMNKLPGKMLRFSRLSMASRRRLYFELGKTLAQIHCIATPSYGWIYNNKISRYPNSSKAPFASWKKAVCDELKQIESSLIKDKDNDYRGINKNSFVQLLLLAKKAIGKNIALIPSYPASVLLHGDFTLRNVLATKKKHWEITGIIDVERARSGHNEFELASLDHFLYDKRNILNYSSVGKAFLKGYCSKIKLTSGFEKRKYLYLLISLLHLAEEEGFRLRICNKAEMRYLYRSITQILNHL